MKRGWVTNKVTLSYGPYAISHRESFGWVDPVIGLRAFYGPTDEVPLQVKAISVDSERDRAWPGRRWRR